MAIDKQLITKNDLTEAFEQFGRDFLAPAFESIDKRFDATDARFDAIDVRFAEVDEQFLDIKSELSDIKSGLRASETK